MADKTGAAPDRANEKADVARRIMELSGTITEAVDHMLFALKADAKAEAGFDAGGGTGAGAGIYAGMIKEIGEGLVSLEGAVSAISAPDYDTAGIRRLDEGYDTLSECIDAMVDACIEGRIAHLPSLGNVLKEAFAAYSGGLAQLFGNIALM